MAYVMIIDDDDDFASAVATVLMSEGYEIGICCDPTTAIESMNERCPDLAILDVMFPENTSGGFELARTMRHSKETISRVPILMLTAINASYPVGFSADSIDSVWMPVSDFLEKPVPLNVLLDRVSTMLGNVASGSGTVSQA